jgi:DegT/DnrJ/EryC1/StrS aminotransferase family
MQARFVPFYPSTAPSQIWGPRSPAPKPFPLNQERATYYYFARNGIWHAIHLLGLTSNDEVLMPAYNNGMELAPFQHCNIPLRYVHVDRQMRLDLQDLKAKITPRTRLVYIIHYLGFPQPVDDIRDLCRERGFILFEDCALSFGSHVHGSPLGSIGDLSIFCLAKFLPVPNGGVLVFNNSAPAHPPARTAPGRYSVASQLTTKLLEHFETQGGLWASVARRSITRTAQEIVRLLRLKRVDSGVMQFLPDKVDWGMSKVSQRILDRVQYDVAYRRRRDNYLALLDMIQDIANIQPLFPFLPEGVCPLFFPVLVHDNECVSRAMAAQRVSAGGFWSWFPPGVPIDDFPDTAFLRKHVLELQIHQDLDHSHLARTAYVLRNVMAKVA